MTSSAGHNTTACFPASSGFQAFWVFTAALLACLALTLMTDTFASERNLFNVARNFAFVAIIAIGMTAVIASGGIDLSVGSSVVLSAMVISVAMSSGLPFWISAILALGAALAVGLFNGILIAYAGMPAFVVTLGTLSAARSLAMVLSDNKMIWEFGPDHDILLWIGGGSTFGLPHPLYVLTILTIVMSLAFKWTRWGQHLFAIGSNENAAILTGIPVKPTQGQHLHVLRLHRRIGRHPDGRLARQRHHQSRPGNGTHGHCRRRHWRRQPCRWRGDSIGAVVGALLIEVIRNSLILLGISTFWQGMFIGTFIIVAVAFDRFRNFRS
jgi:ribose transport system permease protein